MAEYSPRHRPLSHVVLEFRRGDLKQMIEILDFVTGRIRPAVAGP
jgi:hypothetical protein